jgi:hypothetical protein
VRDFLVRADDEAHVLVGGDALLELLDEVGLRDRLLVVVDGAVLGERDGRYRLNGLIGARRLGQLDLEALRHDVRRGHHHDDEQHQHDVDHRRHVDADDRAVSAA